MGRALLGIVCLPLQGVLWISPLFAGQDSPVWLDHGLFNRDLLKDPGYSQFGATADEPLGALVAGLHVNNIRVFFRT